MGDSSQAALPAPRENLAEFPEIVPTPDAAALPTPLDVVKSEAFKYVITAFGVESLIPALSCSPNPRIQALAEHLDSARPLTFYLAASRSHISLYQILAAYKMYKIEMSRAEALKNFQQVAADHSEAALAYDEDCPKCKGAQWEVMGEKRRRCRRCKGKGTVRVTPPTERLEAAARLAGFPIDPPKRDALVNQFFAPGSPGTLESLLDRLPEPDAIDVEVEEVSNG